MNNPNGLGRMIPLISWVVVIVAVLSLAGTTTMPSYFWVGEGLIGLFMIRNHLVWRERLRVNDEMHRLGREDINQGYSPFWRYGFFYAVSYERMLFSPRRVRSFYRDSPALKPLGELDFEPPRIPAFADVREKESTPKSATADQRAKQLLDQHLTPQQRETVKQGYLQITGESGRHYCIHLDRSQPNLFTLRRVGRRYGHSRIVCCSVGPYEDWPLADRVLALKLCLESSDEKRLMKTAVKSSTDWVVHETLSRAL